MTAYQREAIVMSYLAGMRERRGAYGELSRSEVLQVVQVKHQVDHFKPWELLFLQLLYRALNSHWGLGSDLRAHLLPPSAEGSLQGRFRRFIP